MIFGKKAQEQRDKIISYKRVFDSPEGKQVLFDLMNKFHILNTHGGDTIQEGQRSVVLWIMQQCNINLAQFDALMKGES